jgi:hypothetical protein
MSAKDKYDLCLTYYPNQIFDEFCEDVYNLTLAALETIDGKDLPLFRAIVCKDHFKKLEI